MEQKNYTTITLAELAEKFLHMKDDEEFTFALQTDPFEMEGECWLFAKKIVLPAYGSSNILIDYCGGASGYVIPLPGIPSDDEERIRDHMIIWTSRIVAEFGDFDKNKDGAPVVYLSKE